MTDNAVITARWSEWRTTMMSYVVLPPVVPIVLAPALFVFSHALD